jgi:hypothetical protein
VTTDICGKRDSHADRLTTKRPRTSEGTAAPEGRHDCLLRVQRRDDAG